ncbi:MAG: ParB/Srx family N-terminal domain-containing protein [Bryobacteraceae bacterium]
MAKSRNTSPAERNLEIPASGDMQIVMRPLNDLVPNPRNSRTHSDRQVNQIAESILAFGFNNPVLTHGDMIVAGGGRFLAAQRLRLKEVPTVDLAHLSADQARAYVIADNKIASNSEWDEDILAEELDLLASEGIDKALLGFDDEPEKIKEQIQIRPLDISELAQARFWINVDGPLPKQMDALEAIKKYLGSIPGVLVNVGVLKNED